MNRRELLKYSLASLGSPTASKAVASLLGPSTGKQPLGPFFPFPGTPKMPVPEEDSDLTFVQGKTGIAQGRVITVNGKLTDRTGQPISGAGIIIWQASSSGRYNHQGDSQDESFRNPRTGELIHRVLDPNFQYWGRAITDANGHYAFRTIIPGFYPADLNDGWYRPPHIHFQVNATGHLQLVTQMYFKGEILEDNDWIQELNARDPLLQSTSLTREQKEALVCEVTRDTDGHLITRFDISMV
jgi:protocatechuate 3,4-dioxygenase beta subunit